MTDPEHDDSPTQPAPLETPEAPAELGEETPEPHRVEEVPEWR